MLNGEQCTKGMRYSTLVLLRLSWMTLPSRSLATLVLCHLGLNSEHEYELWGKLNDHKVS